MPTEQIVPIEKTVPIDAVHPAKFNPPDRILKGNLKPLMESMRALGLLSPIAVTAQMEVGDGHRRLAAAKELGWTEIAVRVYDMSVEDLWIALNRDTRPIKSATWLNAVHLGLTLDRVPEKYRFLMSEALRWLGEDGLAPLAERMKSTDVIKTTIKLSNYIGDDSDEFRANTLRWIIRHNMHLVANRYTGQRLPSELLLAAIEADRPLVFGYTVG